MQSTDQALVDLVLRGMSTGPLTPEQQALVDAGLAAARGPILSPTRDGVARAGELRRLPAGSAEDARVRELLRSFLPVNRELRQLCTDWQCRPDGSANDHTDVQYDAAVRDRLDDIHRAVDRILRRLTEVSPELAHYRGELLEALDRLDAGDMAALTSPTIASYHTVWMWLHQELLLMLGMSRAEDEALEEQLVAAESR